MARTVPAPPDAPVDVLRALAHPVRLELVSLIAARGPICSCHLEEGLGHPQPQISKHLATLRRAGLIEGRREGRWVFHSVNQDALDAARGFLDELDRSARRPHAADEC
jgi:ArsR family transcriptional regulator